MQYLTVDEIEAKIVQLAGQHATYCHLEELPNKSHQGRKIFSLRIGDTGEGRPRILVVAGVHAREWAPPDSLLTFVEKLLVSMKSIVEGRPTDIVYGQFVDSRAVPEVFYKEFTIPYADVDRILKRTELYIVPMVNPDGRAFTQSASGDRLWRKNMRPKPAGVTCTPLPPDRKARAPWLSDDPTGVDLNRNFEVAWDIDKYYSVAAINSGQIANLSDPCSYSQDYHGPKPSGSNPRDVEPEITNIADLIRNKKINFYMDIHSDAGKFLYAWGSAPNQENVPTNTFLNVDLDRKPGPPPTGGRDPTGTSPAYAEWMPPDAERLHSVLGESMRTAIWMSTGYPLVSSADAAGQKALADSDYPPMQAIKSNANLTTGSSRDFAFSQQIGSTPGPPISAFAKDFVYSYTFECGHSTDGGFQPRKTTEYPKVEREVGAGLAKFLSFAATWTAPVPSTTPAPTPSPAPTGKGCFIATAAYGSPMATEVQYLREFRDQILRRNRAGLQFFEKFWVHYYEASPLIVNLMESDPAVKQMVRWLIVEPMVRHLRSLVDFPDMPVEGVPEPWSSFLTGLRDDMERWCQQIQLPETFHDVSPAVAVEDLRVFLHYLFRTPESRSAYLQKLERRGDIPLKYDQAERKALAKLLRGRSEEEILRILGPAET